MSPISASSQETRSYEKGLYGKLASLQGVIFLVAVYSIAHNVIRLFASSNLGEDDPVNNLTVQTLELGYWPKQPPLYDWVLWLIQQVTGPTLVSFVFLKYSLLIVTVAFLFLTAKRVFNSALWALLTAESVALLYHMTWRFHEGFANSVGAIACTAICLWLVIRILQDGRRSDFILLGVVVGAGLLTRYIFGLFCLTMVLSIALQPAARSRFFRSDLFFSAVIAAIIISPFAYWIWSNPAHVKMFFSFGFAGGGVDYLEKMLHGLRSAAISPVSYFLPLILIYLFCYSGMWRHLRSSVCVWPNKTANVNLEQILLHQILLSWVALFCGAIFFTLHRYAPHDLTPVFLPFVVWLGAQAKRGCAHKSQVNWFVRITLIVTVFMFVARVANLYGKDPFCKKCRWGIPYQELSVSLKDYGFQHGTIISYDKKDAGNLRVYFPDERILSLGWPYHMPPGKAGLPWLYIWRGDNWRGSKGISAERAFRAVAKRNSFDAEASLKTLKKISLPWTHLWKPKGYRKSLWYVVWLKGKKD